MTRFSYFTSLLAALLLLFVSTAATDRGGFELRAERPASDGTVLVVHTYGCDQPSRAKLIGTAEGLVAGQRQSIPLKLKATAKGVYAIAWQPPAEGTWVLAVTGTYRGQVSSLLVNINEEGQAVLPAPNKRGLHIEPLRRNLTAADVQRALKQPTYKG